MRRGSLLCLCLIAAFTTVVSRVVADEVTHNIQSIVLDNFDDPSKSHWIVQGSKFAAQGFPQAAYVKTWPDALYRTEPQGMDLHSLGIHGEFDRMGYNYIELTPATVDSSGQLQPSSIPIPGRAQSLDLWVWGSNRDFYMDIQVQDYRGVVYVLHLGNLNYRGWRDLTVDIPTYIRQSVSYIPSTQSLQLRKIVIWTTPLEQVGDFYVYLDQLKVLTDTFESPWDGEKLANPADVQQLWANAPKAGTESSGSSGNNGQSSQSNTQSGGTPAQGK